MNFIIHLGFRHLFRCFQENLFVLLSTRLMFFLQSISCCTAHLPCGATLNRIRTHAVHCLCGRVPCIDTGPGLQQGQRAQLDGRAGHASPVLLHGPRTAVRRHFRHREGRRHREGLLQGSRPVQTSRLTGALPSERHLEIRTLRKDRPDFSFAGDWGGKFEVRCTLNE